MLWLCWGLESCLLPQMGKGHPLSSLSGLWPHFRARARRARAGAHPRGRKWAQHLAQGTPSRYLGHSCPMQTGFLEGASWHRERPPTPSALSQASKPTPGRTAPSARGGLRAPCCMGWGPLPPRSRAHSASTLHVPCWLQGASQVCLWPVSLLKSPGGLCRPSWPQNGSGVGRPCSATWVSRTDRPSTEQAGAPSPDLGAHWAPSPLGDFSD